MNINEPDEVLEKYRSTAFPSRTVLGTNIPETCRGCGTVQFCNLRIEDMADLCTGKKPAPAGSIRIGDTVLQIRKDMKKSYPVPHSFQWREEHANRIRKYLIDQLGFAWIKTAAITISDYEITLSGPEKITIGRQDDEFALLTMKGQRDLILNAKITPNGEYWYINRHLIKRKVLTRFSDSAYIPESALSHNPEEEEKTTFEDYSATPYLSSDSDIPYWIEQEDEQNVRATPFGFEVVTRKQRTKFQMRSREKRQEKFLQNHGFRLKTKLQNLLATNPQKARTIASRLSFTDWQALSAVGGIRKP